MHPYDQYTMSKIAYNLVKINNYRILHIDEKATEIWLEKYQAKTSHVVRIIAYGFNWKNHLKQDVGIVFDKVKGLKKYLRSKHVIIHNVYVSSYTPVDEWKFLKNPLSLEGKQSLKMMVYYLSQDDKEQELSRLYRNLNIKLETPDVHEIPESGIQERINYYQFQLQRAAQNEKREMNDLFFYGKPFFTYTLLAINIIMFGLLSLNGGSQSTETLIEFGAKYNPAIIEDNEWWRIITSMFLHIGLLHLFMNMLALYYLGVVVERIYGSWRFSFIYFSAGIGGGIASFAFTIHLSAGASGAIFGLFGALLYFGLLHKRVFFQTMGTNLLLVIGINIVFGLSVPQIDNSAHLGGLLAGFWASAIINLPAKRKLIVQLAASIIYISLISWLVLFGIQNNTEKGSYQLMKINTLAAEENYREIIKAATKGLKNPDDSESQLLFQRSYAYIQTDQTQKAIEDLERAIQLDEEFAKAYYNLSILYYHNGQTKKAEENIRKAYNLKPDDANIKKLYKQIIDDTKN